MAQKYNISTRLSIGGSFGGFSKIQIVTYYAVMSFVGYTTFWWVHFDIANQIRSGDLSNLLSKPMRVIGYFISYQMGDKLFSFLMRLPIFIAVFYFFGQQLHFSVWAILAIFTGAVVSLLMCLLFGILAFYLTDLGGFVGMFYFATYLLSGELAPLSFYPDWFLRIAMLLPFRYILSFPIEILMNKVTSLQIISGFITQVVWIVVLAWLLRVLWIRSLKTYQAYGK